MFKSTWYDEASPINFALWIGQIDHWCWCLARSISTYYGTILRVDCLYTQCKSDTLCAPQEIHKKIGKFVAENAISKEIPATKRHGPRWKIQKMIVRDRFPTWRLAPSEPPRLEIFFAWRAVQINLDILRSSPKRVILRCVAPLNFAPWIGQINHQCWCLARSISTYTMKQYYV